MKKGLIGICLFVISCGVGWSQPVPQTLANGWLNGTVVPSICSSGNSQVFYLTTGSTNQLYDCINNVYVLRASGSGGSVTPIKLCTITDSQMIANGTTIDLNCGSGFVAKTKVIGVTLKHSQSFAGTGISSVTASLGVGSSAPVAYSGTSLDVFQAVSNSGGAFLDAGGWGSYSFASHQPTVHLITNVNMGNGTTTVMTGGSLDVWVLTAILP